MAKCPNCGSTGVVYACDKCGDTRCALSGVGRCGSKGGDGRGSAGTGTRCRVCGKGQYRKV